VGDVNVQEIMSRATDATHVKRVFGEPIERDGIIVIPVATVMGGAGGGRGTEAGTPGEGSGAGLGVVARPAGVYVIKDGDASWRPAVNVNRIVLGGQVVAVVALLVLRSLLRRR
jgi:uncharacterized spore protein YtfJ